MRKTTMALAVLSITGCGPSTYEDCLLQNLKGDKDKFAAQAIMMACEQKFEEKKPTVKSNELKPWEVSSITGRGGIGFGNSFHVTLYNGNKNITVSEVTIEVKATIGAKQVETPYKLNVFIPPQTTSEKNFDIIVGDKGSEYSWSITGAKGY